MRYKVPMAPGRDIFLHAWLIEVTTDRLPGMPSRAVPVQFGTLILSGAVIGIAELILLAVP